MTGQRAYPQPFGAENSGHAAPLIKVEPFTSELISLALKQVCTSVFQRQNPAGRS